MYRSAHGQALQTGLSIAGDGGGDAAGLKGPRRQRGVEVPFIGPSRQWSCSPEAKVFAGYWWPSGEVTMLQHWPMNGASTRKTLSWEQAFEQRHNFLVGLVIPLAVGVDAGRHSV